MGKKNRKKDAAAKPKRQEVPFVERPFEGLKGEADLVAMRELLPSASAPLTLTGELADVPVLLVTLLPEMWPAIRREDGTVVVAMQASTRSGDASRDVAHAIEAAAKLEPGTPLRHLELPEVGARLQDLVDPKADWELTVHGDFHYWADPAAEKSAELDQALEQAAEHIVPSKAVEGVSAAYWCRMGKEYLRWVRTEDEYELLDALAKLHAADETPLEDGTRLIGFFRSCGLMVPVWELNAGTEADELAGVAKKFEDRLAKALADDASLTPEQRRARSGLISREVTLR
ncbi:hypothetical protein BSZ39_00925 [Bowdeniella nasicola]|uniref:DUF5926 domain-containing protein n=1 Tax=Bowdeniella nasicola TaxID=208480 RepID=A0A1Q5Q588_9ACTO|nr:DUF5926 family protein [Bowdeniella nasicola]OKL54976.1 hypothetical protein BSZ39_00925 [Bowdeniella nasicola]